MMEIIGHRGARGLLPENSLPGFEHAIALGVDRIELDIHMSRDGVVVVHHDPKLNLDITRDANGHWLKESGSLLSEIDFAELSQFDIGRIRPDSLLASRFPNQEPIDGAFIPTLRDVLLLGKHSLQFDIECKLSSNPTSFAKAVAELLKAEAMIDQVAIRSFDWRILTEIHNFLPDISLTCLTCESKSFDNVMRGSNDVSPYLSNMNVNQFNNLPELVHHFGATVWSPFFKNLDVEELTDAFTLGLRVDVWTVNEISDMQKFARLGVNGIITDYPDRALSLWPRDINQKL